MRTTALKNKRVRFDSSRTLRKIGFTSADKPLVLASCKVAYEIAKNKKTHTIAENAIKLWAVEMASIVLGKEAKQKLQVPLSDNVMLSRISDKSNDILNQVIIDVKNSPTKILIQLDKSTDIVKCCQLLTMVRYVKDKTIREESLFCKPLQTTITIASDIFNSVKGFFIDHDLHLSLIGSICTDEAPAILGNRSGFAALLKKEVPTLKVTPLMIHSQALASKSMPKL